MRFLGFRLYGPLVSFGDVAVGERRPSLGAPGRSMVLGLVGCCLGVRREDEERQAALDCSFGVATRTDAVGELLVDYHTAQAPDGPRVAARSKALGPVATRREEVHATFDRNGVPHALDTQLSQRQYRTDAAFAICLWTRDAAALWSLEQVAERLKEPVFAPFAGRKGAALAMLFEPQVVIATDPVSALRTLTFGLDWVLGPVLRDAKERTYRWDGDWAGLKPERTEVRRDRVHSRARWQFITRDEHVLTELAEFKEGSDVSESA